MPSAFASDPTALAVVERMKKLCPRADPLSRVPDVHPGRIPRHIAIIMDGNGRWAHQRGLPREAGHRVGAETVRRMVEETGLLGVEALTLYSFSLENWKRPREEVESLMKLCLMYLAAERDSLVRQGVRLRVVGRREGLPPEVRRAIEETEAATSVVAGPTLCLAINYGGRAEIADAARTLALDAKAGRIDPASIDEASLAARLSTAGLPDPDLLIRTAGESRVSNFLLWQISYAEIHVSRTLWPDFGVGDLHAAVRDFASRRRRFGGLDGPD